jgi:hypothetical protein
VLDNLDAGKIENFYLLYGRRPYAAFGNSSSDDQQMLEFVKAGTGARLSVNDEEKVTRVESRVTFQSSIAPFMESYA